MTLHYQPMKNLKPLYTEQNCNPAYQLNWSYTAFWKEYPGGDQWLDPLRALTEADGIRILSHRFSKLNVSQFLVSTKPSLAPIQIAMRIKGRIQYLVRKDSPKAFRRNYCLESIGATRREKLESYLRGQLEHHDESGARDWLYNLQMHRPDVDLSNWRYTSHARFRYGLHVCLEWRRGSCGRGEIEGFREMLIRMARRKGLLLGCGAILTEHCHLMLGCNLEQSPQAIALSCLNNLAYSCEMRPLFKYSYFVATFGEYDLGVVSLPEEVNGAVADKPGGSAKSSSHRDKPGGEA